MNATQLRTAVQALAIALRPVLAGRGISGRLSFRTSNRGNVIVTVNCAATHGNLRQDTATVMGLLRDACVAAGLDAEYGMEAEVIVRPRAAAQAAA